MEILNFLTSNVKYFAMGKNDGKKYFRFATDDVDALSTWTIGFETYETLLWGKDSMSGWLYSRLRWRKIAKMKSIINYLTIGYFWILKIWIILPRSRFHSVQPIGNITTNWLVHTFFVLTPWLTNSNVQMHGQQLAQRHSTKSARTSQQEKLTMLTGFDLQIQSVI